jgi:hypothetical protein
MKVLLALVESGPDMVLFSTPHPAFRMLQSIRPGRVRFICYLRTQHFLKISQSLSDRIRLLALRYGIRARLVNSYYADLYLLPGRVNLDYVRWCGAKSEDCCIIGYHPKPRVAQAGACRIIIATQNWTGHGFEQVGRMQEISVASLYAALDRAYPGRVVVRPHPREKGLYAGLRKDTSSQMIETINTSDILISDLSSFVSDCWVRGAKVILWATPGAQQYNQAVYDEYRARPFQTNATILAEVARLLAGLDPVSTNFCSLTVSEQAMPRPDLISGERLLEA